MILKNNSTLKINRKVDLVFLSLGYNYIRPQKKRAGPIILNRRTGPETAFMNHAAIKADI
jgi:hypothetical protein